MTIRFKYDVCQCSLFYEHASPYEDVVKFINFCTKFHCVNFCFVVHVHYINMSFIFFGVVCTQVHCPVIMLSQHCWNTCIKCGEC